VHNPHVLKLQGCIYHRISNVAQTLSQRSNYSQFYFLETAVAYMIERGIERAPNLDADFLKDLGGLIMKLNQYAQAFRMLKDIIAEQERRQYKNIPTRLYFVSKPVQGGIVHPGRLNLPVSNEIFAIYIDDDVTKNPNEHESIPHWDCVSNEIFARQRILSGLAFNQPKSYSANTLPKPQPIRFKMSIVHLLMDTF
jgi:hypothetical protein